MPLLRARLFLGPSHHPTQSLSSMNSYECSQNTHQGHKHHCSCTDYVQQHDDDFLSLRWTSFTCHHSINFFRDRRPSTLLTIFQKQRKSYYERKNNSLFFFLLFMLVAVLSSSISLFIQRHQDNIYCHARKNLQDFYVGVQGSLQHIDTAQPISKLEAMNRSRPFGKIICRQNITYSFNLTYYVGKLQTQNQFMNSPNDEVCGLSSPCSSMNDVFEHFSSLLLKDMETYICLQYNMTIIVISDLIDNSFESTANCRNTVPEIHLNHNNVNVDLTVTSLNREKPSTVTCFYENDGERLYFIEDRSAIILLSLSHITMQNMYLNPFTIQHSTTVNSNIDMARTMDNIIIENSKFLESRIQLTKIYNAELRNLKLSGGLLIEQCSQILIQNLTCFEREGADRFCFLRVSTVDDFILKESKILFGKRGNANFQSVVTLSILNSNFEYVSTSPTASLFSENEDTSEYVVEADLVFQLNIMETTFSNRNNRKGWLKVISGGTIYFSGLKVENNTCKTQGVFLLYICQSIRISYSSFLNNVANVAGAISVINVKDFTISDSSFHNNTAMTGTGAVGIFEAVNSRINKCKFSNNTSNNGDGGAVSLIKSVIYFSATTFIGNRATVSGGAIYAYNSLLSELQFCTFEENMVYFQAPNGSCITKPTDAQGSGGAVALHESTADVFIFNSFVRNKAARGGAVFVSGDMMFSFTKFENNFASVAGGACFVTNNAVIRMKNVSMIANTATIYGPDISTPVVYFSEIVETIPPTKSRDKIVVYPGESFTVKFMQMYDRYSNYIKSVNECPVLSLSDHRFLLEYNWIQLDSNMITLTITIDPSIDIELSNNGIENILHIRFSETDIHNLTILLTYCPTDFVIKNGKCAPGFPFSQVIPGIIAGSLVFMLIGIIVGSFLCSLCAFGTWRAFKKARSIYARQRSEKEIEEKLLTYDVSYGSLNSDIHISKTSNYIIPASELKFEKKIGEGASGR